MGTMMPFASMNAVVSHCAALLSTENTPMNVGMAVVMRFWLRTEMNEPTIMTATMAMALRGIFVGAEFACSMVRLLSVARSPRMR